MPCHSILQNKLLSVTACQSRGHTSCPMLQRKKGTSWPAGCPWGLSPEEQLCSMMLGKVMQELQRNTEKRQESQKEWSSSPLAFPKSTQAQRSPVTMSNKVIYNCAGTVWIKLAFVSQKLRVQWCIPHSKCIPIEICHQAARARKMGSVSKASVILTSPHLNTCLRATAEFCSRCSYQEDTNKL